MTVVLSKKNNIKNKGFTLVELLAVVAIIALLVAIAIFSVNRLFGSSRDKTDEINLESIKESAVTYANENYTNAMYWVNDGEVEYACVPILELINKGYLKEKEISEYKNSWQFIKVNRDAINKTIISEEKGAGTCYYGVDDNGGVIFTSITKTTTSIKLQVQCNDTSKEVKGISFAFKDREYTDQMTTLNSEGKYIYEFSGLKSDKSYDIKARCNYMDGTTSKDAYKTEKTGTMNYKFILPDGSETKFNDNVKKIYKTIEIDFSSNEVTVPSYYFKSTANYTFSNKDVLECGNGSRPNSCISYTKTESGYDGTKLREGYWYKINNNEKSTSVALDVYDNATILALGYDGGIYLDGKSTQITFMSNPYVILNITHSNSDYSYEPKGFLGGENDVPFYTEKWMSMPKISWQIYGGYKTKSYVYYSNSTANYNSRGTYNTNNVVSGYNGKTTCNVSNKCYIDATNFTKGGMQEIGIVVVNTTTKKETIIKVKVNIDKLKPEITVVNDSGGNWTNKDVITTVSYEDDHSGINPVTLSWKKGNGSYTTYTDNANNLASRNVTWLANNTWAGNYTVYYKICDNAGNCSIISTPIKIDITEPTLKIDNSSGGSWTNADSIKLTISYSDANSGIDSSSYRWKDNMNYLEWQTKSSIGASSTTSQWTAEGDRIAYYKICDNAGNCTEATTPIKIDRTKPTAPTDMEYVFGDWTRYTRGNWTYRNVYAASSKTSKGPSGASDTISGVAKYQISSNGSTWVDYSYSNSSSMYYFSTEGTHIRYFRACDKAGNCGASISRTALIEKTAPTIRVSVSNSSSYTQSKTATVTLSDDGGGGLASTGVKIYYAWGTGSVKCSTMTNSITITPTKGASSATKTFTISSGTGDGDIYVCNKDAAIYDVAGNSLVKSTVKSASMKLDNTGPTVSASVSTSWSKTNKTISASAIDDNVGTIGGYYISTSTAKPSATASGWQTGTTFSKGLGTYYIWAKDSLGNVSSSYKKIEVTKIETTKPAISVSVSNGTSYTKSKIATITIRDSDSGLSGTSEVIKYAWGTRTVSCGSMSSKTTITYSTGAKSASKTVSIEDKTGAGKIYICNNSAIKDVAGNSLSASNTASDNMYLDNTDPIVNISIKNKNGATITSAKNYQGTETISYNDGKWSPDGYQPTISFKITDDSSITNEVYYNSVGVYTGNPVTAKWLHDFNESDRTAKSGSITINSDGIRQLKFVVTDVAGNTSTISVNAWLDFAKPSPPTSVKISGTNLVLSGSYDNQSGLKNDRISFYCSTSDTCGSIQKDYSKSTVALSDFTTVGSYWFGTSSDDNAGNNSGTENGVKGDLIVAEKDVPVCPDGYSDYGDSTYCRDWVEDICSYRATKTTSNKSCWLTCNPYNLATACYVTKYVTESGCKGGGYNWYEWGSYRICYANSYWCSSCSACGTNTTYSCPKGGSYGGDSYCYWDCSGYDYEKYLEDTFDCQEGYTEGSNGLCYKLS